MREISMTTNRIFLASSPLTLGAIGVLLIATACLIAFPGSMAVWQAASWSLVAALLALCFLVPLSAYSLATLRVTRTWQRIASCATGFIILVVVAIGWLT
ncbi:hypothetical protein QLQ15_13480 [Lysobacter sp. LF1]|uniref:DUF1634 domain-containing protein n=1 Tax=Lysobacter stagni TaxID=3045172 RepID=A0ABT6XIM4_9GAMM|nr:hypothetical protein [Lysobacter sp. LF1]MDI9239918.1 hypothetical protein [Lysobacter sp. LF1]